MTTTRTDPVVPRAGMLATVRKRRGVVAAVEPFDGETGRLHLVYLQYTDDHGLGGCGERCHGSDHSR